MHPHAKILLGFARITEAATGLGEQRPIGFLPAVPLPIEVSKAHEVSMLVDHVVGFILVKMLTHVFMLPPPGCSPLNSIPSILSSRISSESIVYDNYIDSGMLHPNFHLHFRMDHHVYEDSSKGLRSVRRIQKSIVPQTFYIRIRDILLGYSVKEHTGARIS